MLIHKVYDIKGIRTAIVAPEVTFRFGHFSMYFPHELVIRNKTPSKGVEPPHILSVSVKHINNSQEVKKSLA